MPQEEFTRLDYLVTQFAFESQNSLGRLCDETIYENDLAARISAAGLGPVQQQLPLILSHRDFTKTYYLDLVVAESAVYELKTAIRLINEHETQLLNYMFIWGTQHGKLINFRSPRVECRFVNAQLSLEMRRRFKVHLEKWCERDGASERLRTTFVALLEDWGAFLDFAVYLEALTHFVGGEHNVIRMVPLARDGISLGNQRLHLLTPDTGFCITALTNGTAQYEQHLSSLLRHSGLRCFQWINLDHHDVHFVTWPK